MEVNGLRSHDVGHGDGEVSKNDKALQVHLHTSTCMDTYIRR